MYKANKQWTQKLLNEGYTIIDMGYPKNQNLSPSVFYNIEVQNLFK